VGSTIKTTQGDSHMSAHDKVVIITGAGTGIGKAVATAFLKEGYRVALAGRRQEPLTQVVRETGASAEQALTMATNVRDPASVRALFAKTKEAFGRLDVLFNNAGISAGGVALEDLSYEQWQAVVETNLTGAFLCTQEAFKIMKSQDPRGGRIINNGSVSATAPRPNSALDGRKYDIACGQIDIGNALTEATSRMPQGVPQANGSVAAEPVMDVQHVASAVLYMASLPLDANVLFMTVMATKMPLVGRG
jgi:NADP-dependent 3-hydroxy acid dehydrogenase YdfG